MGTGLRVLSEAAARVTCPHTQSHSFVLLLFAAAASIAAAAFLHPTNHRYHFNTNLLLAPVTKQLKWADGAAVRAELLAAVEALLGPKTEADLKPPEKKKKPKVCVWGGGEREREVLGSNPEGCRVVFLVWGTGAGGRVCGWVCGGKTGRLGSAAEQMWACVDG